MSQNIIALLTLPRHILTQGTAIRSLMRNLGALPGCGPQPAHDHRDLFGALQQLAVPRNSL